MALQMGEKREKRMRDEFLGSPVSFSMNTVVVVVVQSWTVQGKRSRSEYTEFCHEEEFCKKAMM